MKLNDFKIASDSSKKRYYYHMALSCKDWSLRNLRDATMIGSKIDIDRNLNFPC